MKKFDVIIIGAGPAGMTAALYIRCGGFSVLVVEKEEIGGQIIDTPALMNYPGFDCISGKDFSEKIYMQAKDRGAEFQKAMVKEIEQDQNGDFIITTNKEKIHSKAVIIATGVRKRRLNNENFKKYEGNGLSYRAAKDGGSFVGKTVTVLGGGNSALTDALFLSDLCKRVYLVHRRNQFRGEEATAKLLKQKENVTFLMPCVLEDIKGKEKVESAIIKNIDTGELTEILTDGIFPEYGNVPVNGDFKHQIKLDSHGFIDSGEDCLTNIEGIFAAGDCRKKEIRQVVTATSDGSITALKTISFLKDYK